MPLECLPRVPYHGHELQWSLIGRRKGKVRDAAEHDGVLPRRLPPCNGEEVIPKHGLVTVHHQTLRPGQRACVHEVLVRPYEVLPVHHEGHPTHETIRGSAFFICHVMLKTALEKTLD